MISMASPPSKTTAGSAWLEMEQKLPEVSLDVRPCHHRMARARLASSPRCPDQARGDAWYPLCLAVQPDGQLVQGRVSLSPRPRPRSVMRVSLLASCGEALSDPTRSTGVGFWEASPPQPATEEASERTGRHPGFQWGTAAYFSSFHRAEPQPRPARS